MSEPKWDYLPNPINYSGISDEFICKLQNVVNFPDEHSPGVKSYIEQMFIMYKIEKENSSRHNHLFPNTSSLKAAATSILSDVNNLLKKLNNEAGGIAFYHKMHTSNDEHLGTNQLLNSLISDIKVIAEYANDKTFDLSKAINNRQGVTSGSMEGLKTELTVLREVCEAIPEKIEVKKSGSISGRTPKQGVVSAIAWLFRDCFHINPSIYISKDHGASSQYARFLSLCFIELEGSVPGDLKKLMSWERKKWDDIENH